MNQKFEELIANTEKMLQQCGIKQMNKKSDKDESYIIDLCDEVLKEKALRQHCFSFLKGDAGTLLPVDAYYKSKELVIEYHEKQHTESIKLFDNRMTTSGVSRGEQRKIYDNRRKEILPQHGIKLVILSYSDFEFNSQKRIIRSRERDLDIIRKKLNE